MDIVEEKKEETASPTILTTPWKGRIPRAVVKEMKEEKEKQKQLAIARKNEEKQVILNKKLDLFMDEFVNTDGNATEAAMRVWKCKSRAVAAQLGSEYLKKARELGRVIMEKKGLSYGKLISIASKKVESSKGPEWWDRLMKLAGYGDFISKEKSSGGPGIVNIINAQKEMIQDYIEGEVVDEETTE